MERLKVLREQKGLSREILAADADMSPVTIWRYETGQRSPTVEQLEKLARVLDVEVSEFFPKAQASLWSDDEAVAARRVWRITHWGDLLKGIGGMMQDLEGTYNAAGSNFEVFSSLCWTTTTLYRIEAPKARATSREVEYLEEAEGVLRLGVEMMQRRAEEGRVISLEDYRAKSREALAILVETA